MGGTAWHGGQGTGRRGDQRGQRGDSAGTVVAPAPSSACAIGGAAWLRPCQAVPVPGAALGARCSPSRPSAGGSGRGPGPSSCWFPVSLHPSAAQNWGCPRLVPGELDQGWCWIRAPTRVTTPWPGASPQPCLSPFVLRPQKLPPSHREVCGSSGSDVRMSPPRSPPAPGSAAALAPSLDFPVSDRGARNFEIMRNVLSSPAQISSSPFLSEQRSDGFLITEEQAEPLGAGPQLVCWEALGCCGGQHRGRAGAAPRSWGCRHHRCPTAVPWHCVSPGAAPFAPHPAGSCVPPTWGFSGRPERGRAAWGAQGNRGPAPGPHMCQGSEGSGGLSAAPKTRVRAAAPCQ